MNENHKRKFLAAINELRLCEFDNKKMGLALDFEKREVSCCENVEQQWKTIFGVCIAWEIEYENFMVNPRGDIFENRLTHSVWARESSLDIRPRVRQMVGEKKEKFIVYECLYVLAHMSISIYEAIIQRKT